MNRMMSDILGQPASLARVMEHQFGAGSDAMHAAAAALRESPRIVITGMGASLFAATPLADYLRSSGRDVQLMEAGELLYFGQVASGSTVILVSRSGETIEAVRLLPMLKATGARIIGVANEPGTTLVREADIPVQVNSERDTSIVAVQTYTATVMATLLLGSLVTGEDWREEAEKAVSGVRHMIDAYEVAWAELLEGAPVVYVLGRGPSFASAQEGALLFHETAKLPAVAMSCAGFRHGPVEAVDENLRAIILTSQPKTRELDEALAQQIKRMGGRAQTIAAEPGVFAPLVEIVPLQFAAYQAAVLRGFEPGVFRNSSLVTASETDFAPVKSE